MDKAQVAAILDDTGNLLELTGASPFETRAYQNAARIIGAMEGDIEEIVRSGGIAQVPGVGKTLAARITELVTTGHMALYDKLVAETPPGLREMLRIPGLGPKRVRQISEALNITTIADLRAACENGRVAELPGFGVKSQEKILKGLDFLSQHGGKYRFDIAESGGLAVAEVPGFGVKSQEKILKGLDFLSQHGGKYRFDIAESGGLAVADALRALPQVVRLSVAGSLRRKKDVVKDIDVVASVAQPSDRGPIMDALVALPEVVSITGKGDTKTSVVLRQGIALDLRVVTDDEYPTTLHHFTGSREHNIALRGRAQHMGIKINEYGLFRGDERLPITDERDFYQALGLHYIEPELREDRGEIEAAEKGELPRLVTAEDLRGILHVHSTWSDGQVSIREMAEATMALGKEYLGICDHSKIAAYAHGLNEAAVHQQQEEIDRLNEEYAGKFRILKGTECDILKDGALDFDDKTLASFDFVVASIHSQFQLPPEEQTQRLIRAIENPYCSILGHPTGRILLERDGYQPDMERVIERAGELGVSIELNADPHRFDLDWRLIRFATERGVRIPINPDAHSPSGLLNIRYGVGVGRKGWLTPRDVLNTLPVDELLAFFAEQRRRKGASA